ncbi:MAG: hypothetical protein H0W23_09285, partial [Chloroflexia bacterium]|nr:hypothetical protein [Chloroflexia bacterium]
MMTTEALHGLAAEIDEVRGEAVARLDSLESGTLATEWEREFLGPKGRVTTLLRGLGA